MANVTALGVDHEEDEPEDVDRAGWLADPWYGSRVGIAVVAADVLLTIALVAVTTDRFESLFVEPTEVPAGVVPWYIYVFGVLGALGYVFTTLTVDFDRTTGEMIQSNFRLPAALPLGAGVFLFADVILGDAANAEVLVVGLIFLSGLFVNLAYRQLAALAKRLLPGSSGDEMASDAGERADVHDA